MKTHRIRFQTVATFCAASYLLGSATTGQAAENETKPRPPSKVSISISSSEGTAPTAQLAGMAATHNAARQGLLRPVGDGPIKTVDDFRGRAIIGADQKRLGQVDDFIVDTATGNVVYAVVAPAGEGSLRLVQKSSLKLTGEGFVTELNQAAFDATESVTREQLDADQFTRIPDESRAVSESVAQRSTSSAPLTTPAIGLLPSSADSISAATTAAAAHPDPVTPATTEPVEVTAAPSGGGAGGLTQVATHLVRASTLRGTDVSAGDERLGAIEAIALDMDQGTATAVLAMKPAGAGSESKYLVPLSTLQFGAVSDAGIATSLSRSDFERALSLSQLASSSEEATPSDEERLSPTGRTGAAADNNAATGVSNVKGDTGRPSQAGHGKAGDRAPSANAGSSDASGGFNLGRAMSGRGVGGTPPDPQARVSEPSDRTLAGGADSAGVVTKVREALDRDDSLAAEAIEVNVTGKTIQLRGTVRSEAQKTRVEAAARKAAGLTPIENQIQVQQR